MIKRKEILDLFEKSLDIDEEGSPTIEGQDEFIEELLEKIKEDPELYVKVSYKEYRDKAWFGKEGIFIDYFVCLIPIKYVYP